MTSGNGNLVSLLLDRARNETGAAASYKHKGQWQDATWHELAGRVESLAEALVKKGLQPGDRVALFANTCLDWVVVDLAISAARGIVVPIYASNTPEECQYLLQHSQAVFLFVDDDMPEGNAPGRLSRARSCLKECPSVRELFVFSAASDGGHTTLEQLVALGKVSPEPLEARARSISQDDVSHFIYTSGTTGNPKGVMLTHGNWAYEAQVASSVGMLFGQDSVMLFLPLAHSFAQVVKAAWLGLGFKMIFAESVDKLVANLAETQPTLLPAVPRVFEKVYSGVTANALAAPGLKGVMARWAFGLFDEYVARKNRGEGFASVSWVLAQRLVFSKVRKALSEKLGGRMRLFVSGGAPLPKKVGYFFDLLGFKVLEGYGLTETTAASSINRPENIKIGTVGQIVPGTEVRIAEDGEILIRGPGVMKGYYQNEAATREVLTQDGWFHTGDIGELDAEGFIRITDRKKDIIVTSGGKNIAPQNLENLLKTYAPVSQAMVYGDKRKYLTVLIALNEEWARKRTGNQASSYAELSRMPVVREEIQRLMDEVNATLPSYSTLKDFRLLPQDLSQANGELTPTLKVKRKFCTQKYKALLDSMYEEAVD